MVITPSGGTAAAVPFFVNLNPSARRCQAAL
jgi:hypothetical protein